ncbi:hypothetical protein NBRC116188_24420 [Oceaniserpentilla sp. 4NH20-0058]|uniref:hypothetical protein n=1 Tax=Oceaniserpentilla sp. 4NH20-0058 TaxID=3127660 RepID=UPI003101CCA4
MSKKPGTAAAMPVTGTGCGVRPSKEAMEISFSVDFSKAKQFLDDTASDDQKTQEKQPSSVTSEK